MILRTKGPDRLPAGYEIVLYISMSDSDKVGVFYVESEWSNFCFCSHCPSLWVQIPQGHGAHRVTHRYVSRSSPEKTQWPVSIYFPPVAGGGSQGPVAFMIPEAR